MNEEEGSKGKPVVFWLFIISILVLILIVVVLFFNNKTSLSPKASFSVGSNVLSVSNSYVFASPVRAKAGGDLIRVTVFALDSNGLGVFDQKVLLKSSSSNLTINSVQGVTDETGKSFFDIASSDRGTYTLDVFVNDLKIDQRVRITFD